MFEKSAEKRYMPQIEFRPDDFASPRVSRVGLTTFFQNLDLSWLAARSRGPL
jgi:hypothetical protein